MGREYTFRHINSSILGWHPELAKGEGSENYSEWFWLDGQLEGGYYYSAGLFIRKNATGERGEWPPGKRDWPVVELTILTPDEKLYFGREFYPVESFKPAPFGGAWAHNIFDGKLGPEGRPEGFSLKLSVGDIGADLVAHTVATGVQFSDEEHGYSYYNPVRNLALGWWPVVARADVEGTLTIKGKQVKVKGHTYCERQLMNILSWGTGGQSIWSWGHFYAGDYTAAFTDSAASERYNHRHFTPFVLWKGSDVVLSTFQFAACVEKYGIHNDSLYPEVLSLRASDGIREMTAQFYSGKIVESWAIESESSTSERHGVYCRQFFDMRMQLKHWGKIEEVAGTAVHEYGAGPEWFPFDKFIVNKGVTKR